MFGLAHAIGIAQDLETRKLGRTCLTRNDLTRDLAQALDIRLEPPDRRLDLSICGRTREQILQAARAVAIRLEAHDRFGEMVIGLGLVDQPSNRPRDVREKLAELIAAHRRLLRLGTAEDGLHFVRRHRAPFQFLDRYEAIQRALQLTHVCKRAARDRFRDALVERLSARLRFPAQNRDARLVVGCRDVDNEPAREARQEPLIEAVDLRRRTIARKHDLAAARRHHIPRADQLFLRAMASREELHIIEQQQLHFAETVAKRVALTRLDGLHDFFHEVLERVVQNVLLAMNATRVMAEGHDEVRLAEAGCAVDEKWIVARAGRLCDATGCRNRKTIACTDDEGVERKPRIQLD